MRIYNDLLVKFSDNECELNIDPVKKEITSERVLPNNIVEFIEEEMKITCNISKSGHQCDDFSLDFTAEVYIDDTEVLNNNCIINHTKYWKFDILNGELLDFYHKTWDIEYSDGKTEEKPGERLVSTECSEIPSEVLRVLYEVYGIETHGVPTYDYKCLDCFEEKSSKPIFTCPNCGSNSLLRLGESD